MLTENKYCDEDLLVCLRAVFGRVDRIRNQIDQALQQDDAHRRRREMRFLLLPTRFPRPESMGQGDITVWTNWIHEESEVVMNQLDEELIARVTQMTPLMDQPMEFFIPYRITFHYPFLYRHLGNRKASMISSEHLWKSPRSTSELQQNSAKTKKGINVGSTQGANCELSEHSLVSPDPMRSI